MKKLCLCLIFLFTHFAFSQVPYIERLRVEAGEENKGIIPITFTSIDKQSFTLTIKEISFDESKEVIKLTKFFNEGDSFIFNFPIANKNLSICVEYQCWEPRISANGQLNINEARFGYSPNLCKGRKGCLE